MVLLKLESSGPTKFYRLTVCDIEKTKGGKRNISEMRMLQHNREIFFFFLNQ